MLCKQDGHPTDGFSQATAASAATLHEQGCNWYVAYTKPRQESVAAFNLKCQNFDTYLPLFKVVRKRAAQSDGKQSATRGATPVDVPTATSATYEPMFPRYLFFKPASRTQSIAAARSSRGVHGLVSFGTELAMVSPAVVHTIRELEAQRDNADIASISPFQPGRRVRLRDTALEGIEGVVHAVGAKRVVLLMHILGRQKKLSVTHSQLELV